MPTQRSKLRPSSPGLILVFAFLFAAPAVPSAHADELDDVLKLMVDAGILDAAIVDARDMLDCLIAKNGDATACFNIPTEAEKQAGKAANTFMPDDPKVQGVIQLVFAVQNGEWLKVIEIAGLDIMSPLLCENTVRASGPVGSWFCSGPFQEVVNGYLDPVVEAAFSLLNGNVDVGTLFELVALLANLDLACKQIPDELPGVSATCSVLGKIIAEIGGAFVDAAKYGAKLAVASADALENLLFGDDSHISYDKYYGSYWLPWLHKSVNLCITQNCSGTGQINENIWNSCVDYFDSHNQYRSTAKKTCDDMRDKRYHPSYKLLAEAIQDGARGYIGSIRPGARAWAITEYGKNNNSAIRSHFLTLCETELEQGYPLTSGNVAMCEAYNKNKDPLWQGLYESCKKQVALQQVSPTAWRNACKQAEPSFIAMLNTEKQALQNKLSNLAIEGCAPPPGWTAQQGLRMKCQTYSGFDQCLTDMVVSAGSICSVDREKADLARAKEIHAFLGATRCTLSGTQILCHRPWKKTQCQQLVKGTPSIQVSKTALICAEESVEYYKIAFANQALLDKVNFIDTRGGQSAGCSWIEDKAKIKCLRTDRLEMKLAADLSLQRPICKADPNYDGADESCYLLPYNMKTAPQENAVTGTTVSPSVIQTTEAASTNTPATGAAPVMRRRNTSMSGNPEATEKPVVDGTAAPGLRTIDPPPTSNQCSLEVSYYVPQAPIVESSSMSLQAGDQVQIQCTFERRTRQIEWPQCDSEAQAAMNVLRTDAESQSRYSGIVTIDDSNVGVVSSPPNGDDFQSTRLWSFNEPGDHQVACRIDNALRYASKDSPIYLDSVASLAVGGHAGENRFTGFEPGTARRITTTPQKSEALPVARDKRFRFVGDNVAMPGTTDTSNPALNPQPEVPSPNRRGSSDRINPALNPQPEVPSRKQAGDDDMIDPSLNPQPEVPSRRQNEGDMILEQGQAPLPEPPSPSLPGLSRETPNQQSL